MLALKVEHTQRVLERARRILEKEAAPGMDQRLIRAALLAALYHDVGRFPQFERWHTFSDAVSVNHGQLGCALLKRRAFLEGEEPFVQRLVRVAVCLHNRHHLPPHLEGNERFVTDVVRDADKLDIFRIMAEHLNGAQKKEDVVLRVRDEPEKWSGDIAAQVVAGQVPSYSSLRYVNDFRLLLVSWLHDLSFACSKKLLVESGYLDQVLAGLPQQDTRLAPVLEILRRQIAEALQ